MSADARCRAQPRHDVDFQAGLFQGVAQAFPQGLLAVQGDVVVDLPAGNENRGFGLGDFLGQILVVILASGEKTHLVATALGREGRLVLNEKVWRIDGGQRFAGGRVDLADFLVANAVVGGSGIRHGHSSVLCSRLYKSPSVSKSCLLRSLLALLMVRWRVLS
ncbi:MULTISPECIES: hypothetical protein [unclassified Pseudomonas]|uniref:hypothetical protein n=1 Tax=unclassified Pseudomonas TaxID=196821 RepID=UPI00273A6E69|nr:MULTISPECIES: hypothetical protein [unclassified Pseudomonas]